MLFQHSLGWVCLEGQIFASVGKIVSTRFNKNNREEVGALRAAFGVAEMTPKVIERNVNFFFGDLITLREMLVEWKVFQMSCSLY